MSDEKMNAWLIYSDFESKRNKKYIEFYMEEGKKLDISIKLLIVEKIDIGVKDSKWFLSYKGEELLKPAFAICRMMYPMLTTHLENMGIRVYNNSFISDICNDKAKTYQFVAKTKVAIVDTTFCKKEFITDKLELIPFPSVIKSTDGHGGTEVFLLEKKEDIEVVLNSCHDKDIVIQPFVGKNHQDLRVYVIGNEIIAAVMRTAREGFKSNFCLGGEVSLYKLSSKEKDIIYKIINLFKENSTYGFGFVGIDFIIGDQGELLFNEIEDVVGSRMLYQCTDINVVKLYLEFIRKNLLEFKD